MRLWAVALVGSGLAVGALAHSAQAAPACNLNAADAAHAGDPACARAWLNANLHINQLQLVGTAESYKLAPSAPVLNLVRMGGKHDAEALDFNEPAISAQLDAGARALSFDIAYDPKGGAYKSPAAASMASDLLDPDYVTAMSDPGFKVIHVLDVDYHSSCLTLKNCLGEVANWAHAHQTHNPIFIFLHANEEKTPMPGAAKPEAFDAGAFAALEDELKSVFRPGEIITPDQVRGAHATLREAVTTDGWPTLGQGRGKVILVLDAPAKKLDLYGGADHSLAGKLMFVTADEASPMAGIIAIDDPVKGGARIADDVRAGFIVRTRADDETVEARANDSQRRDQAFASGAQIVQTNFLLPDKKIGTYSVSISDARHTQCDSKLAPDICRNWNTPGAENPPVATATTR